MSSFRHSRLKRAFTLLEVLLVVAAIAILAGIVIFAVNPGEILAKMRNSQREADVSKLTNAIYQYAIDHAGNYPTTFPSVNDPGDCQTRQNIEICKVDAQASSCAVNLSALVENQKYLVELPEDPQGFAFAGEGGTGYSAEINTNNRIIVCAPKAELGVTIEVVK